MNSLIFKVKKTSLIQWLAVIGVFLPAAFNGYMFTLILEFGSIIFSVFLIYTIKGSLDINKKLLLCFFLIFIFYSGIIILNNYPFKRFIQQIIMLTLYYSAYYIIFNYNRNTIHEIIEKYLKLAYIISILAILQFTIYFFTGVSIFKCFSNSQDGIPLAGQFIRVNVTLLEPAGLAKVILPALVYYTIKSKFDYRRFLVFFSALFFTFATASFVIFGLAVFYKFFFKKHALLKVFIFSILVTLIAVLPFYQFKFSTKIPNAFNEMNEKLEQSFLGISNLEPENLELLNLSSYATLMNLYVALKAPSRLVGTGPGTHPDSYVRVYQSSYQYYGANKEDAYSIFTRVFSEMGILGIILLIFFIIKNFNSNNFLNIGIFFYLLVLLLRGGHYTLNGVVFFIFLYYFTNKHNSLLNNKLK